MDEYIDGLKEKSLNIKGESDRPLDAEELAQYRSLLAKARWPVNRVAPELAYGVSALAQLNTNKVGEVTVNHAKELDKLVQRLKMLKNSGPNLYKTIATPSRNTKRSSNKDWPVQVVQLKAAVKAPCLEFPDVLILERWATGPLVSIYLVTLLPPHENSSLPKPSFRNHTN